jgi:hypothetical protein
LLLFISSLLVLVSIPSTFNPLDHATSTFFLPLNQQRFSIRLHHIAASSLLFFFNFESKQFGSYSNGCNKILLVNYISVTEPTQKWGVRLPGSGSGDFWRSENACKHTYEAFKIIISLKIKLLHFNLKITMIRSRMFFKR